MRRTEPPAPAWTACARWIGRGLTAFAISAVSLAALCTPGADTAATKNPPPPPRPAQSFPALESLEKEVGRLVEATRPSVVGVVARASVESLLRPMSPELKMMPAPAPSPMSQLIRRVGSGLVVDRDGNVATLASVVAGASEVIVVPADGRRLKATIRGTDDLSGLAVLSLEPGITLPPVLFGDSADLRVGSVVTTLGISQEASPVFSVGFVSGMGVSEGPMRRSPYLKLDAWSSPGAAGGAVLDSRGQLVGMLFGAGEPMERSGDFLRWHVEHEAPTPPPAPGRAPRASPRAGTPATPPAEEEMERKQVEEAVSSALASLRRPGTSGSGITYALPSNLVRHVTQQIIASGSVRRGWMGVTVDDRGPGEIVVAEVMNGGPAARAGLESGDRLLVVNGQPVEGSWTLMQTLASAGPGDDMQIVVMRDGKKVPAEIQLGEQPAPPQFTWKVHPMAMPRRPTLGVRVEQPDEEELRTLGAADGYGMLVAEVHDDSRAADAGLQEGDLIIRALGMPVRSLVDLRKALRDQPSGKEMEMVVLRARHEIKVMIPAPPEPPDPPPPAPAPTPPQPRRPPRQ